MKYDAYGCLTTRSTRVLTQEERRARLRAADRARRVAERTTSPRVVAARAS